MNKHPLVMEHMAEQGLPRMNNICKQQITLRIDSDILDWFKKQGKGYQTMMNAVLRAYKDSRQDSSKTEPDASGSR